MSKVRIETDSLGEVEVPADKLWGAQTQRSLDYFSIGKDLIPREMIHAYAILKKAAANANHASGRLDDKARELIARVADEILAGEHQDMFPLHVWMTGSGTQFNMNVNEVISNRCCQLAGTALGSKTPVHPNDHVNMSQSSNDTFPSAMYIAAALGVTARLVPAVRALHDAIAAKAEAWQDIVKIGRTHMQDATPITLGQEWSGYAGVLAEDLERIDDALKGVYQLALGGTAVGTGINAAPGFAEAAAGEIAKLTGLPFVSAPNKFAVQGACRFEDRAKSGVVIGLSLAVISARRSTRLNAKNRGSVIAGYDPIDAGRARPGGHVFICVCRNKKTWTAGPSRAEGIEGRFRPRGFRSSGANWCARVRRFRRRGRSSPRSACRG